MATTATVGILRALLTADTAQFDAAMKRSADSAKAWSKELGTIGRQATTLGASLTKTLTLPILGIGVGAAKMAIDFESSFAGVRKTVDATEPEFAAMAQAFRELSKTIPVNVNELARLGEAAGALGIPKKEIVDFSRVMALLGVTTNVTADQAAESIAKIQNIFGAAGKDTERFASTLVDLGNKGASTEAEILELTKRIAAAGNTIGLSQAQVLGFASAIANVGMEAEAGGSAMSRVFNDLSIAVSQGGADLEKFARVAGESSAQFATAFREDAASATTMFIDGLGRIKTSGGDLIKTLNDLGFTELRQADLLKRLAGSGDNLSKALTTSNDAWRENSALSTEAGERFKTTEAQLTILWNRVKDVGITLGNALLPAIESAVSVAGALVPVIDMLARGFAALPGPIQLGVVGLLGLTAAIGPAIFLFGQLAIAASATAGAFAAKGLATRILTTDLAVLTVGLRSHVVAAAATTTTYGVLGAASLTLASAARGLYAVVAAHPFGAIAIGVSLATAALIKYYEAHNSRQQANATEQIKAETIARAEHAGVVLKSVSATERYFEAAQALEQLETIRQARFTKNLDIQKAALEAERALNLITQTQYNSRLLLLQAEEQVSTVRKNRITIDESVAASEKKIHGEITATGYTVQQLTAQLKTNARGFDSWAAQVGLSAEAQAFLKDRLKETTKGTKAAAEETKDYTQAIETQRDALRSLGIVTERDVNDRLMELADIQDRATSSGVSLARSAEVLYDAYGVLAAQAKKSGASLKLVNEALAFQKRLMSGAPVFSSSLFISAAQGVAGLVKSTQSLTGETFKSRAEASLLQRAYTTLGVTSRAQLDELKNKAKDAHATISSSATAMAEDVEAAWAVIHAAESEEIDTAISSTVQAFEQLANISGDSMSAVSRALGTGVAAAAQLRQGFSTMAAAGASGLSKLSGAAGIASAVMTGIAIVMAQQQSGKAKWDAFILDIVTLPEQFKALGGVDVGQFNGDLEALRREVKRLQTEAQLLDDTMGKYGLSINDAGSASDRLSRQSSALVTEIGRLSGAGFSTAQIAGALSDELNAVVRAALDAGTTLPSALQPFINELITAGGLSEDLAAKLLGVAQAAPWQDMEEAAKKYGIEVEHLGTIFQQSKLDDSALQLAADWALFTDHGTDAAVVVEGMTDEVQELITKALKLGLAIPDAMKPVIQAMFDAGKLTDENGTKLEDLSRLEFAAPIVSEFDLLIAKVGELIDAILTGLNPAIEGISLPDAPAPGPAPGGPAPPWQWRGQNSVFDGVPALAAGGIVMRPTLAMVGESGPEAVVPLEGLGVAGRAMTVVFEEDGRTKARYLVPFIAGEVMRLQLTR